MKNLKKLTIPFRLIKKNTTLKTTKLSNATIEELVLIGTGGISSDAEEMSKLANLKKVTLGENITSIPKNFFRGCINLYRVNMYNKLKSIGICAFCDCEALEYVYIYNCKNIPKGNNITSIGDYAFWNCKNLTSNVIGNKIKKIGEYAFAYCTKLSNSVNTNMKDLKSLGEGAFYGSGIYSAGIAGNVKEIKKFTFAYCPQLFGITISNKVTKIGDYAFIGVRSAANPYDTTSAAARHGIRTVSIPKSVTFIGTMAFYRANYLIIKYPNTAKLGDYALSVTNLSKVEEYCAVATGTRFTYTGVIYEVKSKTDVSVIAYNGTGTGTKILKNPTYKGIKFNVTEIRKGAFNGVKMSGIDLRETTKLVKISSKAFRNCPNLKKAYIPNNVKTIEESAFYSCKNFSTIYGKTNTAAYKYAKKYDLTFKKI